MARLKCFALSFLVLLQLIALGYGERTKDKMYEKITSGTSCYRRLNATHQIGCSSKRGGSTGVVHYCDTLEDLNYILQNGTAPPYVPVIPTKLFTAETVRSLIQSGKVSGLILHANNAEKLDYFTHENQCPNPQTSLEGTCKKKSVWNPYGTGLLYEDIPFPVSYLSSDEEVDKIKECFDKFNNYSYDSQAERPLCSLELKSFMYATTNTPLCMRRSNMTTNLHPVKFCDPLGDMNVWAALYPLVSGTKRNETKPIRDSKYIVIAARLDTTSMFEMTAGANSPVTGVVTLLSTARLLKSMLKREDIDNAKKNVLFILFNGETYDYIGSQRLFYDMQRSDFPVRGLKPDNEFLPVIRPENISLFIELSQLGNAQNEKIFVHYLKEKTEISNFYNKLSANQDSIVISKVPDSLPPASLHTFMKNDTDFPGLILTDHETSYTNPFYNSIYDNSSNIAYKYYNATENASIRISEDSVQQFVANMSQMLARSVYQEVTNRTYSGSETADVVMVDELFHCYLDDLNCKLYSAVQKHKLPSGPGSLYVGVDHISNFVTTLTALTLDWFVGDVEGEGNISCTNRPRSYAFHYYNMSKSLTELNVTLCYRVTGNTTDAISPAFIIPDYDWSSGLYSSWTESSWAELSMRMFLKPSCTHEKMTIAIGSISMILSFALVYFVKSRSHILFTPPLATEAPTDC